MNGMNDEQSGLMLRLQQLGLTMDDLREYLDTHLYDDFAIERFTQTAQEYHSVLAQYAEKFGPLIWPLNAPENRWLWAEQPFPWEY